MFNILLLFVLSTCSWICLAGESSDNGYWTPSTSTTVWWTPSTTTPYPETTTYFEQTTVIQQTTYYQQTTYWTPSTTTTYCYTQEGTVVTVTSIIPCPVTSTVVIYSCEACGGSTIEPTTPLTGVVLTTTVTSYTTTTPYPVQTITSNGFVVVVMDTTAYSSQQATASVEFAVISHAEPHDVSIWLPIAGAILVGAFMLAL